MVVKGAEVHLGEMTIRWRCHPKATPLNSVSMITYIGTCNEFPDVLVEIDVPRKTKWAPGDNEWIIFGRITHVHYLPDTIIVHFAHPSENTKSIRVEDIEPVR